MQNPQGAEAMSLRTVEDGPNANITPDHNTASDQQTSDNTQETLTETAKALSKPVSRKIFNPNEIEINKISEKNKKT